MAPKTLAGKKKKKKLLHCSTHTQYNTLHTPQPVMSMKERVEAQLLGKAPSEVRPVKTEKEWRVTMHNVPPCTQCGWLARWQTHTHTHTCTHNTHTHTHTHTLTHSHTHTHTHTHTYTEKNLFSPNSLCRSPPTAPCTSQQRKSSRPSSKTSKMLRTRRCVLAMEELQACFRMAPCWCARLPSLTTLHNGNNLHSNWGNKIE